MLTCRWLILIFLECLLYPVVKRSCLAMLIKVCFVGILNTLSVVPRYRLKQAHVYYVFLLLSWFRRDVQCKFCISTMLNHYYRQLRNQNHRYLKSFLRYCISFWSHFKMILSLKKKRKNNFEKYSEVSCFECKNWNVSFFITKLYCVKRVSTMSRILSECVINMPNMVLFYATLLKAISLRM